MIKNNMNMVGLYIAVYQKYNVLREKVCFNKYYCLYISYHIIKK